MDFVTSVTASKAVPTPPPAKSGADREHDSAGQESGFEEEIAALRDAAAESANTEGELLPTSQMGEAGAGKDGASAESALDDPLAQDVSDVEVFASDGATIPEQDEGAVAPSMEGTASQDVRFSSDATAQKAPLERAGPQPLSQPLAAGASVVPDAKAGEKDMSETPPSDAKQGSPQATDATMPQVGTTSPLARPAVSEAGPRGDKAVGGSNALNTALSKDHSNGPVAGLHGGASRPGIPGDAAVTAAPSTPVGEGTDQGGAVSKTGYGSRADVAGREVILAKHGTGPSPAANAAQGLPPAALPSEAAVRAPVSGPNAEAEAESERVQGQSQDRHAALANMSPYVGRYREQVPDAAAGRIARPAQTTPGIDPAPPAGGASSAPTLSSGLAVTPPFMPTNTTTAPLFVVQAGLVREGVGDAAVFGADLAALEPGRAQPGTIVAGSAFAAEPRGVARQIAEALIAAHENGIDLQLSPEELGRVKLSITPGEAGFLVTVSAERPETLELLRRHIDLLGEEFAALGLGDTTFSFGDSPGHSAAGDPHPTQTDTIAADLSDSTEAEAVAVSTAHPRADTGLLDIRL
ncbi:MAG: flagellar hook-length control protein FliK [Pseudomonadota bacterium]